MQGGAGEGHQQAEYGVLHETVRRAPVLLGDVPDALESVAVAGGVPLGGYNGAVLEHRRRGGVVLNADHRHVVPPPDVQVDHLFLRVLYLGEALDGVVYGVAQKGVDVVVLHAGETGAVCGAHELDLGVLADQCLLGEDDVQGLVVCEVAEVQGVLPGCTAASGRDSGC